VGRKYNTHGSGTNMYEVSVGKPERERLLGDAVIVGRIIL
jgi:hypothetical protein